MAGSSWSEEDGEVRDDLRQRVETARKRAAFGSRAWSFLYNGGLLLSLIGSTAVSIVAAGNADHVFGLPVKTFTAIVSGIAAAAIGAVKLFDMERKWRANRRSWSELEILQTDLVDRTTDIPTARQCLSTIKREHEQMMMAAQSSTPGGNG